MSIEKRKAEHILGHVYNQVQRIAANKHLSVHERIACAVLENAIAFACGEYDRITGYENINETLANCGAHFPDYAKGVDFGPAIGTTNHIYMDRDMLSELIMAVNRNTLEHDKIHIIDSAGQVEVVAERNDKEAYPILKLPSIHIVKHKKEN